ncbi:MAG: hypothetical protein ISR77_37385, partial [Pirellulaceae bacterium]|nr:hypothetical protein [Pirellulaceae bacterium]
MPLPAWIRRLLWANEESRWRRRRKRRRDEEVQLYVTRLEERRLLSGYGVVGPTVDIVDTTNVQFTGSGLDDSFTLGAQEVEGVKYLTHNIEPDGDLVSQFDLDADEQGEQRLEVSTITGLLIDGGLGNDSVTFGGDNAFDFSSAASVMVAAETISQTQPLSVSGLTALDGFVESGEITSQITLDADNDFNTLAVLAKGDATIRETKTETVTVTGLVLDSGNATLRGGTFLLVPYDPTNLEGVYQAATVRIDGATLGGSGSVQGNVTMTSAAGAIAPGASAGILSIDGDVTFDTSGQFSVDINGVGDAGTDYDQLLVTGSERTVSLNDATLDITTTGLAKAGRGDSIVLIENVEATSSVVPAFNGLAEGDTILIDGKPFSISYVGGTHDNDVVLTFDQTPEFTATGNISIAIVNGRLIVTDDTGPVLDVAADDLNDLTINGGPGADKLVVNSSGGNPIPWGGLTFNGGSGDDLLSMDLLADPGNLTSAPITFNGGSGGETNGDSLEVLNTPNVADTGSKYITTPDDPDNSGRIVVSPGGGGNANEMTINFTGLEPTTLSGTGPLSVEVAIDDVTTLELREDTVQSGDGWNILDGDSTYEELTFRGYNTLNVTSGTGAEIITLSSLDTADPGDGVLEALSTVNLDGDNTAGTDTSADVFNIQAAPSGVTLNLKGGGGNDIFNLGDASNLIAGLDGTIDVDGEGGTADVLHIIDTGNSSATTDGVITSTAVTGLGMAVGVTYDNTLESPAVSLGSGADQFNVQSTDSNVAVLVNAGGGADNVTLGNATNGVDGILNVVTVDGQAGHDTLTLDDRNDGSDADAITLTAPGGGIDGRVANGATNFFGAGGLVDLASMISLTIQGGSALTVTDGAVLGLDTAIDNSAGNYSIQAGAVAGSGGPWDLSLDAGTNSLSVGQIGTSIAADDINQVALSGDAGIALKASIYTGADASNNAGSVQINDSVTLAAHVTVDTTDNGGGTDGNVAFSNAVVDDGNNRGLTITAGEGSVSLAVVGADTGTGNGAIGALSIGGNDVSFTGNVEASSISVATVQSGVDDDSISIAAVTLDANGGNISFASDDIDINPSASLVSTGASGATVTFTAE